MLHNGSNPLLRQSFPAEIVAWPRIKHEVLGAASKSGWSDDDLGRLELVLEEGALNIIHHAYPERSGEIEVAMYAIVGGVILSLADTGIPFDPVSAPMPDIEAPPEKRSIGGLGIHLMKSISESIEYRREGERNVLNLVIKQT